MWGQPPSAVRSSQARRPLAAAKLETLLGNGFVKGAASRVCGKKHEACSTVRVHRACSTARVTPWRSGASAPRKVLTSRGFSPCRAEISRSGTRSPSWTKLGEGRGGNKITGEKKERPDFFCWA